MFEITIPRSWQRGKIQRNLAICELYASERYTTNQIANRFNLSRRGVLHIVQAARIIRSQTDGNRVATPLKSKRRIRL